MRRLLLISVLLLAGCASVQKWIPSFWDDNQSNYIAQARLSVELIDCSAPQRPQVLRVQQDLRLFELYSQSKGSAQADVLRVVEPMQKTVNEWAARGEGSKTYCQLKKELLAGQGDRAAQVILGRW